MANVTVGEPAAELEAPVDDAPRTVRGGSRRRSSWPSAAVVWFIVFVAAQILPRDYLFPGAATTRAGPLVEMWMRWDANWYREIVRHGYRYYPGVQSSVAYFPAYPLAVAAVAWAFPGIAGRRPCSSPSPRGLGRRRAVPPLVLRPHGAGRAPRPRCVVLLVYPYAWYLYGAVYSDAFFLLVVLTAFLLVEREQLLAGRAGRLRGHRLAPDRHRGGHRPGAGRARAGEPGAGARRSRSRPVAGGRAPDSWPSVRPAASTPRGLLLVGGPGAVELRRAGGLERLPLGTASTTRCCSSHIESYWGQGAGPRTWFKFEFFHQMHLVPHSIFSAGLMLHALAGLAALLLVPRIARRFGWALRRLRPDRDGHPGARHQGLHELRPLPAGRLPGVRRGGGLAGRARLAWVRNAWVGVSSLMLLGFAALWAMGKYLS